MSKSKYYTQKVKHGWMLVGKNGNPILNSACLPIYWMKSVAKEMSKSYQG